MAEFRVDLEGLELSDEQASRISSGVQKLVLAELAGADFKGDANLFIRDPEWLGIWLRQIRSEDLGRMDEKLVERFGRRF
jgi:hypothetical protein